MCDCNGYVTTSSDEESIRDEEFVVATDYASTTS